MNVICEITGTPSPAEMGKIYLIVMLISYILFQAVLPMLPLQIT